MTSRFHSAWRVAAWRAALLRPALALLGFLLLGAQAAAEALFGKDSAQSRATAAAFDAVEIFAAPSTPEPTPIPVVQGPDSTLFIYSGLFGFDLGRSEKAQGDPTAGSTLALSLSKQRPAVTGNGALATLGSPRTAAVLADPLLKDENGALREQAGHRREMPMPTPWWHTRWHRLHAVRLRCACAAATA